MRRFLCIFFGHDWSERDVWQAAWVNGRLLFCTRCNSAGWFPK